MGGILPYSSSISGSPTTYYNMWEHEQGTDEINGTVPVSVNSYFTTACMTPFDGQPPGNSTLSIGSMQPDLVQTGEMTVTVIQQNTANTPAYNGTVATIYDNATMETGNQLDALTNFKDTAKILRLQFQSNTLGGNYQMGKTMLEIQEDGQRNT
jgi:hypothetical protein